MLLGLLSSFSPHPPSPIAPLQTLILSEKCHQKYRVLPGALCRTVLAKPWCGMCRRVPGAAAALVSPQMRWELAAGLLGAVRCVQSVSVDGVCCLEDAL